MIHPVTQAPPARRVCIRKTTINPRNPADDLTDLICDLGAETILAACIIRQALDDLRDARAGKQFKYDHPWASDPLGELQLFFKSEWFARLAAGLDQDPADLLRMIQAPGPATAPAD